MADSAERTIAPTPRRRQQARDEGQVAFSYDLASAALLIAGLVVLLALGGKLVLFFAQLTHAQLAGEAWVSATTAGADPADFVVHQFRSLAYDLGLLLAPILGLLIVVAAAVNLLQTGFLWLPSRLLPDWNRINPVAGLGRIFTTATIVRLAMGGLKMFIVSAVAFWSLYARRDEVLGLAGYEPQQIAAELIDITLWTSLKIATVLGVLAILDYAYQRWKFERDLRMTPQELREELESFQTDRQLLARRRSMQRQISQSPSRHSVDRLPPI